MTTVDRNYLEASPYAMIAVTPDLRILDVNANWIELMQREREDVLGLYTYEAFPAPSEKNSNNEVLAAVKKAVATRNRVRIPAVRHDIPDEAGRLIPHYWSLTFAPFIKDGTVPFVLMQVEDITDRVRAEGIAKIRLRTAATRANLAFWEYDLDSGRSMRTDRFDDMHGLRNVPNNAIVDLFEHIHPDDRGALEAVLERAVTQSEVGVDTEYRVIANGETRWLVGRAEVTHVPGNNYPHLVGTVVDVTPLREQALALEHALSERNLLLSEVNHRVANSLQLVSSVLSLEAEKLDDLAARLLLDSTADRIDAIAAIHAALYTEGTFDSVPFDQLLRRFCEHLSVSLGAETRGVEVEVTTVPVRVAADTAVILSLIVNELVSNAFKHAFEAEGGRLTIDLRMDGKQVKLLIVDDGVSGDVESVTGLGTQIITGSVEQLGGTMEVSVTDAGWRTELRVPRVQRFDS